MDYPTKVLMSDEHKLVQIITGRLRPRHRRFHNAFEQLCCQIGQPYQLRPLTKQRRLIMQLVTRYQGIRMLHQNKFRMFGLLHQALNSGSMPYIAEFDIPLAVHGYKIRTHLRTYAEARSLMERSQLRARLRFQTGRADPSLCILDPRLVGNVGQYIR